MTGLARTESDTVEHRRKTRRDLSVRLVALGFALLQIAWILAVPPFRGIDEFDHTYRAASVVRGDWVAEPSSATRGTGALLQVPSDIVTAARDECRSLPYTVPADCVGEPNGEDRVVASGAGRYHPAFYAVVGAGALPFEGSAALYAMRAATALCCWIFLVLALCAVRSWARTAWPSVALVLVCTPMVVYSSSIVAPNGLEITAAAALWASLIGLLRCPEDARNRQLLVIGTVAACVVVTLRSLGPMWALLIFASVILAAPSSLSRIRVLLGRNDVRIAAGLVLLATAAATVWVLSMESLVIGKVDATADVSAAEGLRATGIGAIIWLFQSIGSFPLRDNPAPTAAYVCYSLVVGWFCLLALRSASTRGRAMIISIFVASLVVPATITLATLDSFGLSWQGRYTIPLSMGFLIVAGVVLEDRSVKLRPDVWVGAGLLLAVAHVLCPVMLAVGERGRSPGVENGAWLLVPVPVLGLLALAGALNMWVGANLSSWRGR